MSETNGTLPKPVEEKLLGILTQGYQPQIPAWAMWLNDGQMLPQVYLFRDIELMIFHQVVSNALTYYKGAIYGAEFEGPKGVNRQPKPISQNEPLADFVYTMCRRFCSGIRKSPHPGARALSIRCAASSRSR